MLNVKNEKKAVCETTATATPRTSKPLKLQGFEESDARSRTRAAQPGACRCAAGSPDLEPEAWTPEDVAIAIGIVATALLLTYGNILMEMFFRFIGV